MHRGAVDLGQERVDDLGLVAGVAVGDGRAVREGVDLVDEQDAGRVRACRLERPLHGLQHRPLVGFAGALPLAIGANHQGHAAACRQRPREQRLAAAGRPGQQAAPVDRRPREPPRPEPFEVAGDRHPPGDSLVHAVQAVERRRVAGRGGRRHCRRGGLLAGDQAAQLADVVVGALAHAAGQPQEPGREDRRLGLRHRHGDASAAKRPGDGMHVACDRDRDGQPVVRGVDEVGGQPTAVGGEPRAMVAVGDRGREQLRGVVPRAAALLAVRRPGSPLAAVPVAVQSAVPVLLPTPGDVPPGVPRQAGPAGGRQREQGDCPVAADGLQG